MKNIPLTDLFLICLLPLFMACSNDDAESDLLKNSTWVSKEKEGYKTLEFNSKDGFSYYAKDLKDVVVEIYAKGYYQTVKNTDSFNLFDQTKGKTLYGRIEVLKENGYKTLNFYSKDGDELLGTYYRQ